MSTRLDSLLDRQRWADVQAWDAKEEAAQSSWNSAADLLVHYVNAGTDAVVIPGSFKTTVAEALTECCGHDARLLLLAACKHAMRRDEKTAADLLRKFVDAAAGNFASLYEDAQ